MGSYWYVEDPDSEFGYTPVPEDDYVMAIFRITRKHGLKITPKMIIKELEKMNKEEKKNA